MIVLSVAGVAPCPPHRAFELLADWRRFGDWWPIPVEALSEPERTIVLRPLPLVRIVLTPGRVIPGRSALYSYIGGPFRGEGEWSISGPPAGPAEVEYRVRLLPVNRLVAAAAATRAFRAKHRRDIEQILARIPC